MSTRSMTIQQREGVLMTRTCLLALGVFSFSGCVVDATHTHGLSSTLIVDWNVDGTTDPAECRQGGVTDIDIIVETRSGGFVGEFLADCRDFETSIDLDPGRYQASATLQDSRGNDLTTEVLIPPFTLLDNDEFQVEVDFPADSFQ